MNAAQALSLFGDMPKDSPAGQAVANFVGMLVADAKNGGAVGTLFNEAVKKLRNPADPIYAKVAPMDAAAIQGTLNALKGAIDG